MRKSLWVEVRSLVAAWLAGALLSGVAAAQEPAGEPAPAAEPPAAAGEYESIPLDEAIISNGTPTRFTKETERLVKDIMKGSAALNNNETKFDAFFEKYKFAEMTQFGASDLAKLTARREAFFREYLTPPNTKVESHDHLVQLTFNKMKTIVEGNYHPAVRYNAMFIIASLNSKEFVAGANATPPEPYAPAREWMLSKVLDPKQIDAVRLAGLIGLVRHADLNAQRPEDRQWLKGIVDDMSKRLTPLATDKKAPANRSPEGHAWVRTRAIEILGALAEANYDNGIVQTLTQLMNDDTEPLMVRMAALQALGRVNLGLNVNLSGQEIARKMGDLGLVATGILVDKLGEDVAAEREKQRRYGSPVGSSVERPSVYGYSGPGGVGKVATKQEVRMELVRRSLKDYLAKVVKGLEGAEKKSGAISAAKAPAQRQYVVDMVAKIDSLMKVADDDKAKLIDLHKELKSKRLDFEKVVKSVGGPAAPATTPMPMSESPDELDAPAATTPAATTPAVTPPAATTPAGESPDDAAPPDATKK